MNPKDCPYPDKNQSTRVGADDSENATCEFASRLLLEALDGHQPELIEAAKNQLKSCSSCMNILQLQLKLRQTITTHVRTAAPKNLRIEISRSLKRVDLGKLSISDFPPPNPRPPQGPNQNNP